MQGSFNFFKEYKYIIVPFMVWLGIQLFKFIYDLIKNGKESYTTNFANGSVETSYLVPLEYFVSNYDGNVLAIENTSILAGKNIEIVTTKTENKDADIIKNNLDKKYPGLEYFNLSLTKAFNHSLKTGKSIKHLVETDKIYENWFGDFVQNNYIPFLNAVKKELEL